MTTYTIEEGIPIPRHANGGGVGGRPRAPLTPLTKILDALSAGQSVLLTEPQELKAAEQFKARRPERKFTVRKVPREGWRVWRLE